VKQIGSVEVSLTNYIGTVRVSYQLLPLINLQDYNLNLGDIVIGSPNNPEIPHELTEWHLIKAFFQANPKLVGVLNPSKLSFKIIDETHAEFSVAGFDGALTLKFTLHQVPQNVIVDLGTIFMNGNPDN